MERHIDRRSFLNTTGGFAAGALTLGAFSETTRLDSAWPGEARAQQRTKVPHAVSDRVLDQLKSRFMFQISVDVPTIELGLSVAVAALAGGVNIVEMGTPLLKNQGIANVAPAFRRKFPEALLLADLKTMDGGAFEARAVYTGGGNIVDFLALAGVDTAKAICGVRDELRRSDPALARLVFTDIMVPHQGPARQAADVALRMIEAGVDGIGIHLQADARRADPKLIESHYLDDVARTVFERVAGAAPVQVVGGLTGPQAKGLAQAGMRCFVISGNLGEPDSRARYDLPPDQIQRLVAGFIAQVSSAKTP
jgi:3-keto-L-gulonate-6-phosphate decarboxylase